jgi:putative redox protein
MGRGSGDDLAMTMTAVARAVDGGLRQEIEVNGRHTIVTDEPEHLGGTDAGPAPHELLPAMLASCVSTMITLYARARDWDLRELRVEVDYDSDSSQRHVDLRIHLPGGLTTDQVRRIRKVADTCPARPSLEPGLRSTSGYLSRLQAVGCVAAVP